MLVHMSATFSAVGSFTATTAAEPQTSCAHSCATLVVPSHKSFVLLPPLLLPLLSAAELATGTLPAEGAASPAGAEVLPA
jgi:hypothetical protein